MMALTRRSADQVLEKSSHHFLRIRNRLDLKLENENLLPEEQAIVRQFHSKQDEIVGYMSNRAAFGWRGVTAKAAVVRCRMGTTKPEPGDDKLLWSLLNDIVWLAPT